MSRETAPPVRQLVLVHGPMGRNHDSQSQGLAGCSAARTSAAVTRSILIVFTGEVWPATTLTSRFRTASSSANSVMSASLALPFSGGAARAIFARPSHSPSNRVREAPGTALTPSRTPFSSAVSSSMSILYTQRAVAPARVGSIIGLCGVRGMARSIVAIESMIEEHS